HYGELGKVDDVVEAGHQDLIVMHYKHKEVLIPIVDAVLLKVDKTQKQVYTTLPKGLLETYLGEQ
ncbi:MAG: 16S rRNA processing protein RimM, partial [Bacteroidota bacterium]